MLLSVALPVRNGANYLAAALDSLLAQDADPFEVVVSDNASQDETPDILADYRARDERVRIERSSDFLPQAANVNRAVELCRTPWVKLFCHDDLMEPGCLRILGDEVRGLPEPVALIGNGERWLFSNGVTAPSEQPAERGLFDGRSYLRTMLDGDAGPGLPSLTTATVRKDAWAAFGGFDARFVHFDFFLWTRLLTRYDYLFLPAARTVNRIHGAQVAVDARVSLRSVADHRRFWDEFLAEYADHLGLGAGTRLRTRLRAPAACASTLAIGLIKGRRQHVWPTLRQVPVSWWPLLGLLTARAYRRERERIRPLLARHVTLDAIYPG